MAATILSAMILAGQALPSTAPDSVTAAEIRAAYAAVVRIEAVAPPGGDTIIALRVVPPPAEHLLAGFFRAYDRWFGYLVRNGRGFQLPGVDDAAPGVGGGAGGREAAAALQAEFLRRLAADSQFNTLAVPAIAGHLRSSGRPVAVPPRARPREIIPMDAAMQVAVRFFYPDVIAGDRILVHVCTVLNAVRELPARNLALEALVFSAVMGDIMRGDSSRIDADFAPAGRLMRTLDAPGPEEVRLHRAQGVMWGAMARSDRLRQVLRAEAERLDDILPFELRGR